MRKLRCTAFQSKPTTTSEIQNIIKTLKPKKSYGCDKISTKVLKLTAPFISWPPNYICNKVISKGVFPERLKYSVIRPLYKKKGNKRDVSKYRTISLLTSFSKILEKVIQTLLDHLHKHIIMSKEQYGFRRGFTTENAAYKPINEALNALNN